MKLYRFSPIEDTQTLLQAAEYVAKKATKMFFNIEGDILAIKYLTIFAHYENEYEKLLALSKDLGTLEEANNGVKFKLVEPLEINAGYLEVNGKPEDIIHRIEYLRIREPDPYRMQVGCCDFEFDGDYDFLAGPDIYASKNARQIERSDLDMVEFYHPDYDVLAYVVRK